MHHKHFRGSSFFFLRSFVVPLNKRNALEFNQQFSLSPVKRAAGSSHLVVQLPGHVVVRRAAFFKNGAEVDFDELPLGPVTEMTEYPAKRKTKIFCLMCGEE